MDDYKNVKTVAILTAAGVGSRMHISVPKQFLTVEEKPIIVYTMEAFQNHPAVDEIVVACLAGYESLLKAYATEYGITKLRAVVTGGATGQESITNCLNFLKEDGLEDGAIVMIHDGNRPLVPSSVITESIATCYNNGNAVAHVPSTEVIVISHDQKTCDSQIDRDVVKRTQTPHTGRFGDVYADYQKMIEMGKTGVVAYAQVLMDLGKKVYLSLGSEKNFKITTQEDLDMLKALVSHNQGYSRVLKK